MTSGLMLINSVSAPFFVFILRFTIFEKMSPMSDFSDKILDY